MRIGLGIERTESTQKAHATYVNTYIKQTAMHGTALRTREGRHAIYTSSTHTQAETTAMITTNKKEDDNRQYSAWIISHTSDRENEGKRNTSFSSSKWIFFVIDYHSVFSLDLGILVLFLFLFGLKHSERLNGFRSTNTVRHKKSGQVVCDCTCFVKCLCFD